VAGIEVVICLAGDIVRRFQADSFRSGDIAAAEGAVAVFPEQVLGEVVHDMLQQCILRFQFLLCLLQGLFMAFEFGDVGKSGEHLEWMAFTGVKIGGGAYQYPAMLFQYGMKYADQHFADRLSAM